MLHDRLTVERIYSLTLFLLRPGGTIELLLKGFFALVQPCPIVLHQGYLMTVVGIGVPGRIAVKALTAKGEMRDCQGDAFALQCGIAQRGHAPAYVLQSALGIP